MNTTTQVIANFSNDGVKNGKEEGEEDDNADSDTSDEEIEGERLGGDVHIPGLGRIKEVLFIPYNVLAIIKLIKGTKIEVLFNNGTIQLTNDGKEVGGVIVTSGLAYFIPTMNTTTQVIANFSNDGVKNGKEEGERMIMLTVILVMRK
ncbi:hypothetical protein E2320_001790 [Naja naja]|nr:hypothetical protein E2320_001790 [Naja naja]